MLKRRMIVLILIIPILAVLFGRAHGQSLIKKKELRELEQGDCLLITDPDLYNLCKGRCWFIKDHDTRELCYSKTGQMLVK